jgi:hypothetical protein
MFERRDTIKESNILGELYSGENFDVNKYFNDSLSGMSFNFNLKNERLRDVDNIMKSSNDNYKKTSEQFVDVLLGNYQTFMNIGKYVDRIDKNISGLMNTQKNYSILLQNLRKDVEEFTIDYVKYLKDVEQEENKTKEHIIKEKSEKLYFEELDVLEKAMEEDFKLDEFLNPKKGTKRWLEEQPEKLRVLIDEKKFVECVRLVKEIRECELELIDYETKLEIDNVYNYLIEKLTVSISRCSSGKDVQFYLDQMKNLGCVGLAIDTFLNWLSKKLKTKINKIINQDDAEFLKAEKNSLEENSIKNKTNITYTMNSGMGPNKKYATNDGKNNKVILEEIEDEEEGTTERSITKKQSSGVNNFNDLSTLQSQNLNSASGDTTFPIDKKIIKIISEYFSTLEKFLKLMEEYFKINENYAYSSYTIQWLKGEIQIMTKSIENLFAKIINFSQLKSIMRFVNTLFTNFDNKGASGKYIFDLYFINNIKISLEAIINFCMKTEGVSFDLKEYEIKHSEKNVKINCVSELGNAVSNVSQIISDFINEFINNKQKFIGIIFIEEYFFENILAKEFLNFMRNKITKSMANNYDVKSFTDNQESMATTNQILINYGITILSIENLFEFFLNEMLNNNLVSLNSIESIRQIKSQINEAKTDYFSKLFKIKIESHFFRFFDSNKMILTSDLTEEFKEPDRVFLVFYQVIKNLAKSVKVRINDIKFLYFFIVENQYVNFLKIIDSVRQLDKIYDTEFYFGKIGILGLEIIIHGILFIYYCIQKVLGLDEEGKFKVITEKFIDELVLEFGKVRNINIDRFIKNKQVYHENVLKYIIENRIELLKGY